MPIVHHPFTVCKNCKLLVNIYLNRVFLVVWCLNVIRWPTPFCLLVVERISISGYSIC